MRIIHVVTKADLGGAPRVVTELAGRAVRDGHACAVAAAPGGALWDHLDRQVERFPLLHLRQEIRPFPDAAAVAELRRLFAAWKPDIIHLHTSKAGVIGRLAAGKLQGRVVYTIHGFDVILKAHRIFLPVERFFGRYCGAVVPVSEYDRRNIEVARVRGRIELIRNGVSDRRNATPLDVQAVSRLGAARERGEAIVLTIARLAPPKRFDLFVEAARRLSGTAVRFFWIGNPDPVEPAGLPSNVEMLGELAEAGDYANLCDVLLLLSDYEGLPMSILEGLSCGKPIVASAVGGIGEAVDDHVGRLVPNEVGAVAAAVGLFAGDAGLRERTGKAARHRYETLFSADVMWASYLRLYESLIRR